MNSLIPEESEGGKSELNGNLNLSNNQNQNQIVINSTEVENASNEIISSQVRDLARRRSSAGNKLLSGPALHVDLTRRLSQIQIETGISNSNSPPGSPKNNILNRSGSIPPHRERGSTSSSDTAGSKKRHSSDTLPTILDKENKEKDDVQNQKEGRKSLSGARELLFGNGNGKNNAMLQSKAEQKQCET